MNEVRINEINVPQYWEEQALLYDDRASSNSRGSRGTIQDFNFLFYFNILIIQFFISR
jgi:hypothetical protein